MKKTVYFILPILLITAIQLNAAKNESKNTERTLFSLYAPGSIAKHLPSRLCRERLREIAEDLQEIKKDESETSNDGFFSRSPSAVSQLNSAWQSDLEQEQLFLQEELQKRDTELTDLRSQQDERAMDVYSPFGRVLE